MKHSTIAIALALAVAAQQLQPNIRTLVSFHTTDQQSLSYIQMYIRYLQDGTQQDGYLRGSDIANGLFQWGFISPFETLTATTVVRSNGTSYTFAALYVLCEDPPALDVGAGLLSANCTAAFATAEAASQDAGLLTRLRMQDGDMQLWEQNGLAVWSWPPALSEVYVNGEPYDLGGADGSSAHAIWVRAYWIGGIIGAAALAMVAVAVRRWWLSAPAPAPAFAPAWGRAAIYQAEPIV